MIVECIDNSGISLPDILLSHQGWSRSMIFEQVTVGKSYIVYAIIHVKNIPCYMVCSDYFDGQYITYPSLLPNSLFKTIQNLQSKFWQLNQDSKDLGFKDMLYDKYFYGNLVEGYEKEVQIFASIKSKIDLENT